MKSFYEHCFPEDTFKNIDGISIGAFCYVRKIFALWVPIIDTSELDIHSLEIPNVEDYKGEDLPKHLQFKFGVNYVNQLILPEKIGK